MRSATDFRPYQPLAIDFMLDTPRCALWAGCGLGKTVSVLTTLQYLRMLGDERPALVLGPKKVAESVWSEEVTKWEHLSDMSVSPVVGSEKQRLSALRVKADLYPINYENIPWLLQVCGGDWPFSTIVADEATKLKGHRASVQVSKQGNEFVRAGGGSRAAALAKIARTTRNCRFIELSGTPSPNGLLDLWGQVWFLDFGQRLGRTFDAFTRRWFRPGYDGYSLEPLPFAEEQIHKALSDICLSIDPKDWFDLEEPIRIPVYVELPPKARKAYTDMEKHLFAEIGDQPVEAFNAAAKSMKCMQLANGAAYLDENAETWAETHDVKLDALARIAAEAGGMPLLVAYNFRSDLERLECAFPAGRRFDSKPRTKEDFIRGKIPMLFLHPDSAGHGVDGLQNGTNTAVFFGHNWKLDTRQQFIERIGPVRQKQSGLNRSVIVYDIIARDTIDESILERHTTKRNVQDCLLAYMKRKT